MLGLAKSMRGVSESVLQFKKKSVILKQGGGGSVKFCIVKTIVF